MPTLGNFITRTQAEAEIKKFLEIRRDTYNEVERAVGELNPAPVAGSLTYFSDTEISFVFEREKLEQLLELGGAECNGIRVYYGAAPPNSTINGVNIDEGSTTVILVACKIVNDPGNLDINNIISDEGNAAIEYPGGVARPVENSGQAVVFSLLPDRATSIEHII